MQQDDAVFTAEAHQNAVQSREVSFRIIPWNVKVLTFFLCFKPVRGWIGLALMTRRSGRCSPFYERESCRMFSRRELPPPGMVLPLFVLLCRFYYQGNARLRSGWTSCRHKGTFGQRIWSRGSHTWTPLHPRCFAKRCEGLNLSISGIFCPLIGSCLIQRLYVQWPTGFSRDVLWSTLFLQRHRSNPWVERAYKGPDCREVYRLWNLALLANALVNIKSTKGPRCLVSVVSLRTLSAPTYR